VNPEHDKIVARLRRTADAVVVTYSSELDRSAIAIDLRQGANTIEDLVEFIEDLAATGLRCDLTPTVMGTGYDSPGSAMYVRMCDYLRRQDDNLRARAKEMLNG
jgi:hypothetical protein